MLKTILAPNSERAYAALRIVVGVLFAFHGIQKVFGVLATAQDVGTQLWIGGVIELIAGIMIAVGFHTRWAAFISSGTMAVAYFQYHWKFQFDSDFFPAMNGGELAVIYCFVFLYIACKGPGACSVDGKR